MMIKIGLIGYGYWGPNHLRIFSSSADSSVVMCSDLSADRLDAVKKAWPDVATTPNYFDLLKNSNIDAVIVATPTNTHFEVTKQALLNDKHVLCEKPLALHPAECEELKQLAIRRKKILMVGHIFLFNAGILTLKEYVASGELGKIHYAYSTRTNLGPFRYDVNALWDLAPHDVAIFNYLFDGSPVNVSGTGQKALGQKLEDVAFATMKYPGGVMAHMHVSWLDPKKVRQITIVGDKKMIVWDDLDAVSPIKLYDKHVEKTATFYQTYGEFQLLSREGSIVMPMVKLSEPLKAQAQYFLDCVKENRNPDVVDAQKGGDVVRTLCAIQESMERNGAAVNVNRRGGF